LALLWDGLNRTDISRIDITIEDFSVRGFGKHEEEMDFVLV
jgi:hypothetical protein